MINNRNYFRIGCRKNKSLVLPFDRLKIISVNDLVEKLVLINYLQNIIIDLSLDNQYTVEMIITGKG